MSTWPWPLVLMSAFLWGTSDASKATVSKTGVVTGVAAGSAVITAYFAGVTASCTVTVT